MTGSRIFWALGAYDVWVGDHLGMDALLKLLNRESVERSASLEYYEVSRHISNVRNNNE